MHLTNICVALIHDILTFRLVFICWVFVVKSPYCLLFDWQSGRCSRTTMDGAKHSLFCILDTEETKKKPTTFEHRLLFANGFGIVCSHLYMSAAVSKNKNWKTQKIVYTNGIRLKYLGWSSAWCMLYIYMHVSDGEPDWTATVRHTQSRS